MPSNRSSFSRGSMKNAAGLSARTDSAHGPARAGIVLPPPSGPSPRSVCCSVAGRLSSPRHRQQHLANNPTAALAIRDCAPHWNAPRQLDSTSRWVCCRAVSLHGQSSICSERRRWHASREFSTSSRMVVYRDLPMLSKPAMD